MECMCVTSNRNRNCNSNETKQTQIVTKQEEKQPQSLPSIIYIPFVSHKHTPILVHNPHTTPIFHPLSTPMPMSIPKSRAQKKSQNEKKIVFLALNLPSPSPSRPSLEHKPLTHTFARLVSSDRYHITRTEYTNKELLPARMNYKLQIPARLPPGILEKNKPLRNTKRESVAREPRGGNAIAALSGWMVWVCAYANAVSGMGSLRFPCGEYPMVMVMLLGNLSLCRYRYYPTLPYPIME